MNIAILGGGFSGLSAAFDLIKAGHTVFLIEAEDHLGGLSAGFKGDGWDWPLEYTYHHIFSSDKDVIQFLAETGFQDILFKSPTTSSLYEIDNTYRVYPLDTPFNLLSFPLLSFFQKIRAGATLGLMKVSPYISSVYDRQTSARLMGKLMGEQAFTVLFGEMFRRKYGKYAGNILASFFWSRIKKRTKTLGYMKGGFQSAIDHVANTCKAMGAKVYINKKVEKIVKKRNSQTNTNTFVLSMHSTKENTDEFLEVDGVVSTLPSSTLTGVAQELLSEEELIRLKNLKHLAASNLILETNKPIFLHDYWVSLCAPSIPGLVFVQHTNFMDKSHYNNRHILYIGNYGEETEQLISMSKEEMIKLYFPHLQRLVNGDITIYNSYLWKTSFAQPIFDKDFLHNVPHFKTSVNGFYIANLDMTYPYDRGTNYAVKLGREVAQLVCREQKS